MLTLLPSRAVRAGLVSLCALAGLLAGLLAPACTDETPNANTKECVLDVDCGEGRFCFDGECKDPLVSGEGEGEGEEGEGEGEGEAPVGVLSVLPAADVEFGAVRLGVPVERTVTLKNTGPAALNVLQLVLDDNEDGAFAVEPSGAVNFTLNPDEELALLLVYTPRDGSPDQAELKILHTGEGQLTSVGLRAEFKGDSTLSVTTQTTVLSPDTTAIDFGVVAIGDSRSVTLYVRNDGDRDSVLTVTQATLTPQNVGVALQAALSSPVPLSEWNARCADVSECASGAAACTDGVCVDGDGHVLDSVPLTLTFSPQQVAAVTATLTLRTDVGGIADSAYEIAITGVGAAGVLSVTPSPVAFDEVFVGYPERQTLVVKNVGGAALTLTGATLQNDGSIFSLASLPTFPVTLSPGDEIPVDVVCTPVGIAQTSNRIVWAVAGATQPTETVVQANTRLPPELALYDEARAKVQLPTADPTAPVEFGDVYVGRTASRSFKMVNDGELLSALTLRRFTIEGPAADRFSLTTNANDRALPGNLDLAPSRDLTVHYQPLQLTGFADTATLYIESDDPARPVVELQLSGRGIRPVINVSTTAIDFGRVLAGGTPATRTFNVTNTGAGALVITGITAPSPSVFSVVSTSHQLPATLQPLVVNGDMLTVTVRYAPTVANQISQSTLSVQSTDFDRGDVNVDLTGTSGGCPARANASVVVVGDQCVYTCNAGSHACGDACLLNDSPDSCGSSCTPCQQRDNTVRGCVAATSTCTYSCNANARDLNNTLNAPQSTSSDGCEYVCPVGNGTASESCDQRDEDCDGKVDEGLNADEFDRNSTSNAPSATKNTNDVCTAADVIPSVTEGTPASPGTNTINATIYPMPSIGGDDEDWYKVTLVELSNNPFENACVPRILFIPGDPEFYRATFRLTGIPAGSDYDLSIHPADNSCTNTIFTGCTSFTSGAAGPTTCSSTRGGNADEGFNADYTGECGVDDNFTVLVRVKRVGSGSGSCDDYQLTVSFASR